MNLRVAFVLSLAAAFELAGSTLLAGVKGTPHDMTRRTGDIESGPCVYCHVPHKAQGERLWAASPFGPQSGWGSQPIAQLCYTCHNITGGGYGASNAVATAYAPQSHGYVVKSIPPVVAGQLQALPALPYVASGILDCTSCHDAHATTAPFLRAGSIDELCKLCHGRENVGAVGTLNSFGSPEDPYSLHPTDVPYLDIAGNGLTNLHELPAAFQVPTASDAWRLGGHRVGWVEGGGNISCQTCHPVHGGWDYTLGVMPGAPASNLTPVENLGGSSSALCQACHQGGEAEEQVGQGTDHPVNRNDGTPAVTYPMGWPQGSAAEVTCSSCHDVHGGVAGTSLLRRGGNTTDGWCFSCHAVLALVPAYHHSSRENDDPALLTSVLSCGTCHGRSGSWTAHNGFQGFKVQADPFRSALCEACHEPQNPLRLSAERYKAATNFTIDFNGAAYPALHGPVRGTGSHLIDTPDDDSIGNCQIKTTPWERTGGVSKYGAGGEIICESCHNLLVNAGVILGTDATARLTAGWKANLLLEPYEDNSPGVGLESPDLIPGPTLSGLCRGCHWSAREGTPASFVHNPPAHTQESYSYPATMTPYGRLTATILTAPVDSRGPACPEVSSADQTAPPSGIGKEAPGAFSYPAANILDCDSCHRPHGADDDSDDDGKKRILEYTAPGEHGTIPCLECHDVNSQCGFQSVPQP